MMHRLWIYLFIIMGAALLSLASLECFGTVVPVQEKVVYRQCVEGTVVSGNDTCCPADQYQMGVCKSGQCTTNSERWLEMPVCRQSDKGYIKETFEPEAANKYDFTFGEYLSSDNLTPLSVDGEGLPRTRLRKFYPQS